MTESRSMDSITDAAGAGFRLSLALNAVGAEASLRQEMASADIEIQVIAKKISEFSLMLKQVGRIMEENRTVASRSAFDAVTDIKDQSERDFDEIKNMVEMVQRRDEQGHLRGIEIARKVTFSFKKRKMQYLLGQLEYLKDSLAIMLQTLQLGKAIAFAHEGRTKTPLLKTMLQERAEIQNMIVVQYWSFEELRRLYALAVKEGVMELESPRLEDPPPRYDAHAPRTSELALSIEPPPIPPKEEDHSRALVSYQERPLSQLKDSVERAVSRENQALAAPVNDIVDHLLDEWTRLGDREYFDPNARPSQHSKPRDRRYKTRVDSDEDHTSSSSFERSENIGGFMIEGPRSSAKKSVRFKASVEDDSDEEDHRPKRSTRHHIINSDDDTSSSSSSSDSDASPVAKRPERHRSSVSGAPRPGLGTLQPNDRTRRPYGSGSLNNVNEPPSGRTVSRGTLQPGVQPRPVPNQGQHRQGPPPARPNLRPPPISAPSSGVHRIPSAGPYVPQQYMGPSPQASPNPPYGTYFQARQAGPPGPQPILSSPKVSRRSHRTESRHDKNKDPRSSASRNIKKGMVGGAAVAGILELLQGLDGL